MAAYSTEHTDALALFDELDGYKDSGEQIREYRYQEALQKYKQADTADLYEEAGALLRDLGDYRDSGSYYMQSFYKQADIMMDSKNYGGVLRLLASMPSHSERQSSRENAYYYQIVTSGQRYTVDEALDILERMDGSYKD
ncbi:MAG: hypothetical protein LIO46_07305, partial [Clostridiales bacterium]|nr:hypothetical protein [Clostridiales bacterium]